MAKRPISDKLKPYMGTKKGNPAWIKGVAQNPGGKKPGTISIMKLVREYLAEHPKKLNEIMLWYIDNKKSRDLLLKMLDGLPKQQIDANIKTTNVQIDSDVAKKYNVTPSSSKEDSD